MSKYYNPRSSNTFNPKGAQPFKLSRSKLELFMECPKCFYLDRRLGVARPPGFPFSLNSAVDTLLKKEFDFYRKKKEAHPLMKDYGVDAIPVPHKELERWRNTFFGVQRLHRSTNFLIFGAIDDLWQNSKGEYIVVDYKATSKSGKITELNQEWQNSYKRQMEIYQWLLRKNNFQISNIGYFVYCNGITEKEIFDRKLEFEITLIPYEGDDSWVEPTVRDAHSCLSSDQVPLASRDCDFCAYKDAAFLASREN